MRAVRGSQSLIIKVRLFCIKSLFSNNHKILKVRHPNQTDLKTLLSPVATLAALAPELLAQLKQLAFVNNDLHSSVISHLQHLFCVMAYQKLSPISDQ